MNRLIRMLLLVLLAWAPVTGATAQQPPQQQQQAQQQGQQGTSEAAEYILGPGDVVEVDVLGQSEFKTRARVRSDGTIALPFLGNVATQGSSPTAFAQQVASSLAAGGYYINPIVSVEVVSYASRYVIVLGAVSSPGLQPVDREYRISEILARAGGIAGTGADYVILTRADGIEQRLNFEQIATGTGTEDPMVSPGDKIYVPLADQFFIYGQVNAPGAYALKDDMTLRKAIARSGGLSPSGSDRRVSVFRNGEKTKLELDEVVQAGDVIVIGERFF
jgi:polysaccharide export outer membrane protein